MFGTCNKERKNKVSDSRVQVSNLKNISNNGNTGSPENEDLTVRLLLDYRLNVSADLQNLSEGVASQLNISRTSRSNKASYRAPCLSASGKSDLFQSCGAESDP